MPTGTDPDRVAPTRHVPPLYWAVGLGFALGNLGVLAMLATSGGFLLGADGAPLATDFVGLRTAGRLALAGEAAALYDAAAAKAAQVATLGRDFAGFYTWHYPPTALLLVAPLGLGTMVAAQLAWTGATLAACLAAIGAISGRAGALALLGLPATVAAVAVGQNGFLTAALFGGALLVLDRRPVLAGLLIGVVSYKPQFGLLVPLALAAGGHRAAFLAAGASVCGLAAVSLAAFGPAPWAAFLSALPLTQGLLDSGPMGFAKLQSAYGFVRSVGGEAGLAWAAQAAVASGSALWVWRVWRADTPPPLRNAALLCAAILVTPYLYLYDLVLLAPAIAFLVISGIGNREAGLIAAALGALLAFPIVGHASGFAAPLFVATAVALRLGPGRNPLRLRRAAAQ